VIQGPAKEIALIDEGLACDALFVADGAEDARRILDRARALSKTPAYLLRISAAAARPEQHAFGLPARELVAFARELLAGRRPLPRGLAFHLGTGLASNAPYLAAIAEAAGVARSLAAAGIATSTLDLGGGFAARTESRLDARGRPAGRGKAPGAILPALARAARRRIGPSLEILAEPGRALVSSSLHLVARAVTVKRSGRKRTVFLDASRLSHAFFVRQGRHAIATIPARDGPRRLATLAGPLGVGVDVFAAERFPPIEPGDLVVIGSVGAYNRNAGNPWAGAAPLVVPG
jgi:ornithine decarboxylase